MSFISTYEEVKHLLRVNRRAKIFVEDFEFAKELETVYDAVSKLMEDD